MKLLITCSLLLATSFLLPAQDWQHQTTFNLGDIEGLECPNVNTCYAVGNYFGANMWKTTDGQTWFQSENGVNGYLRCVHCWDANTCIIGSDDETFKTTDGGGTWTSINSKGIQKWVWLNATIAYGLGATDGYVYKTTDGGQTWATCGQPSSGGSTSIHFTDENIGYVGQYDIANWGRIYKTTNGGNSWTKIFDNSTITTLMSVWFVNNVGYAVGKPKMFKTTDGGNNWAELANPYMDSSVVWRVAKFIDEQKGYVLGNILNSNYVLKTMDGGLTWTRETTEYPNALINIVFPGDNIGYIGGMGGLIMKSTTTGLSVGIKEISTQENIGSIEPNPFSESAVVRITNTYEFTNGKIYDLRFTIYDLLGREVRQLPIVNNQLTIERGNLGSGIYFYKINNGKEAIASGKLIIQ